VAVNKSFDWENFGVLERWFQVGGGTCSLQEVVAHEGYGLTCAPNGLQIRQVFSSWIAFLRTMLDLS